MPNYTPTEEMLDKIHSRTSELALYVNSKQHPETPDLFFNNQEFLQLMNISKETAQKWRDSAFIGYSQTGNKIYYRLSDIQELLIENYNPKKK